MIYGYLLPLAIVLVQGETITLYNVPSISCSDDLNHTMPNQDYIYHYTECAGKDDLELSFGTSLNLTERNRSMCQADTRSSFFDTTVCKLGNITCHTINNCISDNLMKHFSLTLVNDYVFTKENIVLKIHASAWKYCMAIVCFWSRDSKSPNCTILNLEFGDSWEYFETEVKTGSRVKFERKVNTSATEGYCGIIIKRKRFLLNSTRTSETTPENVSGGIYDTTVSNFVQTPNYTSVERTNQTSLTSQATSGNIIETTWANQLDETNKKEGEIDSQISSVEQGKELNQTILNTSKTECHTGTSEVFGAILGFGLGVLSTIIISITLVVSRKYWNYCQNLRNCISCQGDYVPQEQELRSEPSSPILKQSEDHSTDTESTLIDR